jgi:hypothetical protein
MINEIAAPRVGDRNNRLKDKIPTPTPPPPEADKFAKGGE